MIPSDLPPEVGGGGARRGELAGWRAATESPGELITLDEMERRYVRQVLNAVGGNKTHAARVLGIDRRSLYRRLEEPRHDAGEADDE